MMDPLQTHTTQYPKDSPICDASCAKRHWRWFEKDTWNGCQNTQQKKSGIRMTKVKIPPEDRIYDVDGYWLRAASVCVKDHTETEVSSQHTQHSHHWRALQLIHFASWHSLEFGQPKLVGYSMNKCWVANPRGTRPNPKIWPKCNVHFVLKKLKKRGLGLLL